MKKYMLLVLALICLAAFAVGGRTEDDIEPQLIDSSSCGYNLTWTLDAEGTLTISGTGTMWDYGMGNVNGAYVTSAP